MFEILILKYFFLAKRWRRWGGAAGSLCRFLGGSVFLGDEELHLGVTSGTRRACLLIDPEEQGPRAVCHLSHTNVRVRMCGESLVSTQTLAFSKPIIIIIF